MQPADIFGGCAPCLDCKLELDIPSLHRIVVQILNLCVALYIDREELSEIKQPATNREQPQGTRIIKVVETTLDAITAAGFGLFETFDISDLALISVS